MNYQILDRIEQPLSVQIGPVCGDSLGIFLRTLQSNIGRRKLPRRESHPATKQPEPPEAA